jgi:hypothetical protein
MEKLQYNDYPNIQEALSMAENPKKPKSTGEKVAVPERANSGPQLRSGGALGTSQPSFSNLLAILRESIEKVPANVYALGVVGIVAAASVATILAGGNWLAAVVSGVVMLAGMVILKIFAGTTSRTERTPHSLQATVLTWLCLLAFAFVLALLVAKFYFVLFPQTTVPTSQSPSSPAPANQPNTTQPGTKSVDAPPKPEVLPVKIVVHRAGSVPVDQTILKVSSRGGDYVHEEVAPNRDGVATLSLRPGKFEVSATGVRGNLEFQVSPPETSIIVQIDLNNELVYYSADPAAETMKLSADNSRWAMNGQVHLSVIGIEFTGSPLHHQVTFSVGGPNSTTQTYKNKDVGFTARVGNYSVRVEAVDTFYAEFSISRISTKQNISRNTRVSTLPK